MLFYASSEKHEYMLGVWKADQGLLKAHEAAVRVVQTDFAYRVLQGSFLPWCIVVTMDELGCFFIVLYQRLLHFGTRAGLLGPTTGQWCLSYLIPYQGGSIIGWR